MNEALYALERELAAHGYTVVCGVDEAGRGPLAGPVVAAAVVISPDKPIPGVADSKKLTPAKREALYNVIVDQAAAWAVGMASVAEIEEMNILNASQLAMRRAVNQLESLPDIALVDGNVARGFLLETQCVVKGDARCACIAAASILAKVTRDRLMCEMAERYPVYAFERHKGYPTALHYERLRAHGPCPLHRMSFLRSMSSAT